VYICMKLVFSLGWNISQINEGIILHQGEYHLTVMKLVFWL